MEAKYGRERLDALEATPPIRKWTRPELLEIKEYYRKKIKDIEAGIDPREKPVDLADTFRFMMDSPQ